MHLSDFFERTRRQCLLPFPFYTKRGPYYGYPTAATPAFHTSGLPQPGPPTVNLKALPNRLRHAVGLNGDLNSVFPSPAGAFLAALSFAGGPTDRGRGVLSIHLVCFRTEAAMI